MRKGNIVRNVSFEWLFFSFFVRVWYQNAKKHGKHSKWENKTQPETCILSVFELHTYQTAKMHEKETTIFPKNLYFEISEFVTYKKRQNTCKVHYMGKRK